MRMKNRSFALPCDVAGSNLTVVPICVAPVNVEPNIVVC